MCSEQAVFKGNTVAGGKNIYQKSYLYIHDEEMIKVTVIMILYF